MEKGKIKELGIAFLKDRMEKFSESDALLISLAKVYDITGETDFS